VKLAAGSLRSIHGTIQQAAPATVRTSEDKTNGFEIALAAKSFKQEDFLASFRNMTDL
jgi:hypothetical protein